MDDITDSEEAEIQAVLEVLLDMPRRNFSDTERTDRKRFKDAYNVLADSRGSEQTVQLPEIRTTLEVQLPRSSGVEFAARFPELEFSSINEAAKALREILRSLKG